MCSPTLFFAKRTPPLTSRSTTRTVIESRREPNDAVNTVVPSSRPAATPVESTTATVVSEDSHVNRGHATSADVIELIRRVRARVEQAKGVKLEPEVLLYGQEWKDVL